MIELRALGGLGLRDSEDGREILSVLARVKPSGLLLYLALSPPNLGHSRDKLFALLWPDSSTEKARNSLNQALHVLRSGLGLGVIGTTEGGDLFLEAGAVWCDVAAFDQTLAAGHAREALELYSGHLWDPSDLADCSAFERWLDGERRRLCGLAVEAAVSVAQEFEQDGGVADAAQWLRRARDWAPYDEAVVRPLLKLLYGMGERAAAVTEYDAYEKHLAADLELTPSIDLCELIEEIRSSTAGPEAAGREPPGVPTPEREDEAFAKPPQGDNEADPALETTEKTASIRAQPRASWRTRGRAAAAIVVLGAMAAVGASVMRNGRGDAPVLDPTRVLVDLFQNETGDPSLDPVGRMATDRVTAGLTYTTFVDVVSLGTQLLSLEAVVPDTGSTEGSGRLRALARANGTGTVVWGSYYLQGDSLYFLAHVTDAATGEELTTIEPVRGPVDAPLPAVERLRDRVMTTLATITDPRLANWMRYASKPPTFEAYAEFVEGIELHSKSKFRQAIPYFLRAEALDSDFTMASLWAVFAYSNSGQRAPRDSILQALDGRRGQLTRLDRLLLDYQMASLRNNDPHGALEVMRRFLEIAPGSEFLYKAGQAALAIGRPGEAIQFLTKADPEGGWLRWWVPYWRVLTNAYHEVGDYERELEALDRWRQLHPETPAMLRAEIGNLAALGRIEQLNTWIQDQESFFDQGISMARLARELRAHGYGGAATEMQHRAIEWFEERSPEDTGLRERWLLATVLLDVGRLDEAQILLEGILEDGQDGPRRDRFLANLGVVVARRGDREEAYRISRLFEEGEGPSAGAYGRAQIAVALGERERAMVLLRQVDRGLGGLHEDPLLEPLWDYPPFRELMRPKG